MRVRRVQPKDINPNDLRAEEHFPGKKTSPKKRKCLPELSNTSMRQLNFAFIEYAEQVNNLMIAAATLRTVVEPAMNGPVFLHNDPAAHGAWCAVDEALTDLGSGLGQEASDFSAESLPPKKKATGTSRGRRKPESRPRKRA